MLGVEMQKVSCKKMTRFKKIVFICASVIVVACCIDLSFNKLISYFVNSQLNSLNHQELLNSSIRLIRNYKTYRSKWAGKAGVFADYLIISPDASKSWEEDIPLIIRNLDPKYLQIYDGKLLIAIRTFPRIAILVFAEEQNEYGTKRIQPGLWFWNGKKASSHLKRLQKNEKIGTHL